MIARIALLALAALAPPAMAQDTYTLDAGGTAMPGIVETEVYVGDGVEYGIGESVIGEITEDGVAGYGVSLEPGEEILGFYAASPILRIPLEPEILYETLPVEIDRVTGLPRNAAGWTGEDEEPLGIGCFPQGVCADLNE